MKKTSITVIFLVKLWCTFIYTLTNLPNPPPRFTHNNQYWVTAQAVIGFWGSGHRLPHHTLGEYDYCWPVWGPDMRWLPTSSVRCPSHGHLDHSVKCCKRSPAITVINLQLSQWWVDKTCGMTKKSKKRPPRLRENTAVVVLWIGEDMSLLLIV